MFGIVPLAFGWTMRQTAIVAGPFPLSRRSKVHRTHQPSNARLSHVASHV